MAQGAYVCDPARSRVLLIGSGSYAADGLPDIPSVKNNLNGMLRALTHTRLGAFSRASCVKVDGDFDVQRVGAALSEAAEAAEDVLFIYYCGHGLLDTSGGLMLAVPSTDLRRRHYTAVPFGWITHAFLESAAATCALVLDCCFSGRATEAMADDATTLASELEISGTYVLTSSASTVRSLAPIGAHYTSFTGALLELATRGRHDGPEMFTLRDVYRHLLVALPARGAPRPHQRGTGTAEALVLFRNPTHRRLASVPASPVYRSMAEFEGHVERARLLHQRGRYRTAIPLLQDLLGSVPPAVPSTDILVFDLRRLLADATAATGRSEEAFRQLSDLDVDVCAALGATHPLAVLVRCHRFEIELRVGDPEAVQLELTEFVDKTVRALGDRAPEVIRCRFLLACALIDLAQPDEAATLLETIHADALSVLGADHPDVFEIQRRQALMEAPQNAFDALSRIVDRLERVRGAQHPQTLALMHDRVMAVVRTGQTRRAIRMLRSLLATAEQNLDVDSPLTLAIRHSEAELLDAVGERDSALLALVRVVADRDRVLGSPHPDSVASRMLLRRIMED